MAFQLFKSDDSNNQNIVNDPANEITSQYNPLLVQNNVTLDQVQVSNFDKSYNEEIVEETVPNVQPQPLPIPNNQQIPTPYQMPSSLTPPHVYPLSNQKRTFPKPNTVPVRVFQTPPPAPSYQMETPNYQAVSSVNEPIESDFSIPSVVPDFNIQQVTEPKEIEDTVVVQDDNKPTQIEVESEKLEPIVNIEPEVVIPKEVKQPNIINNVEPEVVIPSTEDKPVIVNEMVNALLSEDSNNTEIENENEIQTQIGDSLFLDDKNSVNEEKEEPIELNSIENEQLIVPEDIKIDNFSSLTDDNIIKIDTEPVEEGFKRCPKCGQKMREDYRQCFVCGTYF